MKTRHRLFAAFTALVALSLTGAAEERTKPWRIGILSSRSSAASEKELWGQVPLGLQELGYEEGRDIVIEWRFASGDYSRLDELATELVRIPVDVIMTDGTPPTIAAQKATNTIPIVFATVGDAVGAGVVKSLSRPGGNVTGISILLVELTAKQLDLLSAAVPRLRRIALLQNPKNPTSGLNLVSFRQAASSANLRIFPLTASTPQEIKNAFDEMSKGAVEAFVLDRDAMLVQQRGQVAALAASYRLPWISAQTACAEAGALLVCGPSNASTYRRTTIYVDKILKGAHPGDLPVEQPTKFELVVNKKTAKALGLEIPPQVLVLADRVIE